MNSTIVGWVANNKSTAGWDEDRKSIIEGSDEDRKGWMVIGIYFRWVG
jgi:hypothetical protein